ncbi:MAG: class I SAM-dependent methyltransferase [Akkermansiaceae bacterium]
MTDRNTIANKISSLFKGTSDRIYTRCKIKTDPLYEGVLGELKNQDRPLLDIGCGMALLAMYLRESGWVGSVIGFDYDSRKIESGKDVLQRGHYQNIILQQGDAREELPEHQGNVTILDILQFFEPSEQADLLKLASDRVEPGGKLIIRSGLKEKNLRFFITWLGDLFAKITFWMKAAPTHYPTAEFFREKLEGHGLSVEIRPFWGKTPFNNYLIVAKRPLQED